MARMSRVEHVSDGWHERKPLLESEHTPRDLEGEHPYRRMVRESSVRRDFRRSMLVLLVLCIGLTFCTWNWYLRPRMDDEWEMKEGFMVAADTAIDVAKRIEFDGVRLRELDTRLVPGGGEDPKGKRRLVFVGDIHGCAYELKKLLEKIGFNEEMDHLITVGDVISKGPDNVEVLDELIRLNASSVRGNHEDRILALVPAVLESGELPVETDSASEKFAKDSALLRQLSAQHLEYLRNMSLMLRIPPLPMVSDSSHKTDSPIGEEILVVHAGLVPAVSLKKQDPYFVMNMRSIHTKTHAPMAEAESKKAKTKAWHDIWCWYNDRLFKHKSLKDFRVSDDETTGSAMDSNTQGPPDDFQSESKYPKPQVVVYGHRSKEGLQIERWTKGLDTGCVKGEELTALVLDAAGKQDIVQVSCKDYRD